MIARFTKRVVLILVLSMLSVAIADDPTSAPSPGAWKKAKSFKGTTGKAKRLTFKVGTNHWRIFVKAEVDKHSGATTGNIRVELFAEAIAGTWAPLDVIYSGQVPKDMNKEFDNGFDKDGAPASLALSISGNLSKYDITIEDQSGAAEGSKPKKKKKD